MNTRKTIAICVGALSCAVLPAFCADDAATNSMSQTQGERDIARQQDFNRHPSTFADAKHVIGMEVRGDQDEVLGSVKDIGVDLKNGRIVEVIIGRGGILGMDEKLVAVPPRSLSFNDATNAVRFNGTSNQLANSPQIKWSEWKEATSEARVKELYQRYGERPYFGQAAEGSSMNNRGTYEQNENANSDTYAQTPTSRQNYNTNNAADQNANVNNGDQNLASATMTNNRGHATENPGQSTQDNGAQNPNLNTQANMDEQNNHGHASQPYPGANGGQVAVNGQNWNDHIKNDHMNHRSMELGNVARATKLMGSSTINDQNEKVGKVENLVIDLPRGRVVEVILASGGFMGIDAELSAVPPQAFQYDADRESLSLNTTKEALKSAPHFKAADWRQACDSDQIARVYSSYHVPDYFADVESPANGAQNVRYHENGLTPMDQGTSASDVDMTKQIRKALVADRTMSVNAQNVKVITINGRVTLRGEVNSDQEKSAVEDAAKKIAGTDKVDDQLLVGPSATPMNSSGTTNIQTPTR